jgi:hypothetical protein
VEEYLKAIALPLHVKKGGNCLLSQPKTDDRSRRAFQRNSSAIGSSNRTHWQLINCASQFGGRIAAIDPRTPAVRLPSDGIEAICMTCPTVY